MIITVFCIIKKKNKWRDSQYIYTYTFLPQYENSRCAIVAGNGFHDFDRYNFMVAKLFTSHVQSGSISVFRLTVSSKL